MNVSNDTLTVKTASGSTNAKIDFIHITPVVDTGKKENKSGKLKVYYNSGKLFIENESNPDSLLQLYNLSGQMILSQKITKSPEMIRLGFPKGLFISKVSNSVESLNSKILIN